MTVPQLFTTEGTEVTEDGDDGLPYAATDFTTAFDTEECFLAVCGPRKNARPRTAAGAEAQRHGDTENCEARVFLLVSLAGAV
jgi:hypothetical protein